MRLACLWVALLLSGCSTPYQPAGLLSGGYSETKLAPDGYRVFDQTEGTERTGQMLDLRAAELTLESGYQKFMVVDRIVNNEPLLRTSIPYPRGVQEGLPRAGSSTR